MMAALGKPLDPWQSFVMDQFLAERAGGTWASLRCGLLVARQNGKGAVLEARELAGCVLFKEELILHSAHEFKTCAEAFLRVKALIDANDWLMRRVLTVRTSHGEEAVAFRNGVRLRFVARSRSSGRGFTGDVNIMDEAQELPEVAITAMMPTMSARPNPQMIFTGTVPQPENNSEVWTKVMQQGRQRDGRRLTWIEWSPGESWKNDDGTPLNLDDRELWYACNPAMGIRVDEEYVQDAERDTMADLGFGRERLSIWAPEDELETVIPLDVWDALTDVESRMTGYRVLGVDMPPTRALATIGVMGRRADNAWHAEIVDRHPGTGWVAARVAELVRTHDDIAGVVMDPGSPAGSLIADVEAEGVVVTRVNGIEHSQGCGMLFDRSTSTPPGLRHLGDPILRDALRGASKRPGPTGAWLWNRRDSTDDISPLVAVTLAGFGLSTIPEPAPVEPWAVWT